MDRIDYNEYPGPWEQDSSGAEFFRVAMQKFMDQLRQPFVAYNPVFVSYFKSNLPPLSHTWVSEASHRMAGITQGAQIVPKIPPLSTRSGHTGPPSSSRRDKWGR